jgi:DNA-binding beta-propeller fold protein YncE
MDNEMDNRQWREFMDTAMGVPPGRVTIAAVRRRLVRRRIKEAAGVLTAVAVTVAGVTGAVRVYGAAPGPAAPHRSGAPTIYAAYDPGSGNGLSASGRGGRGKAATSAVIPIDTATNKAGKPIRVGSGFQIAITPDGKTAYVLDRNDFTVIPVSTATNTAGRPIHFARSRFDGPSFIAITPDGKTVYVADTGLHAVVPVSTATNTAGRPIPVGMGPSAIAITPDSHTAYVVGTPTSGAGLRATVTPVDTATNKAGKPIRVGDGSFEIAITPDGKTAYAYGGSSVTPINTATNTAATPISLHGNFGEGAIAITPDGKTLYALTINPDTVVPINTATNTAGTPINVHVFPWGLPDFAALAATQFVITPDGKTIYLGTGSDSVIPISTATNTVGKTIQFGADCRSQPLVHPNMGIAITPDSKTAYVACENAVIPMSTATNTPGTPIHIPLRDPDSIAITP